MKTAINFSIFFVGYKIDLIYSYKLWKKSDFKDKTKETQVG